jgi:hypothetical protein
VVIYGPAYEELKQALLDELHEVIGSWTGPIFIGGDFNLVRFIDDKSNNVNLTTAHLSSLPMNLGYLCR